MWDGGSSKFEILMLTYPSNGYAVTFAPSKLMVLCLDNPGKVDGAKVTAEPFEGYINIKTSNLMTNSYNNIYVYGFEDHPDLFERGRYEMEMHRIVKELFEKCPNTRIEFYRDDATNKFCT
ncbi:hypothetical protein Tco_0824927 [Tanacetum coccineum]